MNQILNNLIETKQISTFGELCNHFQNLGFSIDEATLTEENLMYACDRLGAIIRSQSLPPEKRTQKYIDSDAVIFGRIYYLICSLGKQKALYLITKEACNLINSTKFTVLYALKDFLIKRLESLLEHTT